MENIFLENLRKIPSLLLYLEESISSLCATTTQKLLCRVGIKDGILYTYVSFIYRKYIILFT